MMTMVADGWEEEGRRQKGVGDWTGGKQFTPSTFFKIVKISRFNFETKTGLEGRTKRGQIWKRTLSLGRIQLQHMHK